MTRKDYINIAAAILATQTRIRNANFERVTNAEGKTYAYPVDHEQQLRGVRRTAAHLADFLAEDNRQGFDPVLFLKNCGYGA